MSSDEEFRNFNPEDDMDEMLEEMKTEDALAVVVGYVPPEGGKRHYSTLVMTVQNEELGVPARIVEVSKWTKDSRLTAETAGRLYTVGTVLTLQARGGTVVDETGRLHEKEKQREEDMTTGVRMLVTAEEMAAILASMERLSENAPVQRNDLLLFLNPDEVFGWTARQDLERAPTLASALQAEIDTWVDEESRFRVDGADEKLAARMAKLHRDEMRAVVLNDTAGGHTGMLYVGKHGRPILMQADRPPQERRQATTGERKTATLVVIDQLVRYEPETARFEGYAVLYDPLTLKTPYVLNPRELDLRTESGAKTGRVTSEGEMLSVLGVASVGRTREEALEWLLPVGAWIELKFAEALDMPIKEGMPETHETKNWATTFFRTSEAKEDGTVEPLTAFSMAGRVPNRTKTEPRDYDKFASSSFYDVPGAYRLIRVYPHDSVVEEATRGREYPGRNTMKARMHDVKTSGLSFFRPAAGISVDSVRMDRVVSHRETVLVAASDITGVLKLPSQFSRTADRRNKTIAAPTMRTMRFGEFPYVYAPGHVNAIVFEAAYIPHKNPGNHGRTFLREELRDSTYFVVAAVKSSAQTKTENYVVYGAMYFEEDGERRVFGTGTSLNVPWVMFKPPMVFSAPLTDSTGRVDTDLAFHLGPGGPEITELNDALRAEIEKMLAYYAYRPNLGPQTKRDWEDAYLRPLLNRFKFKVDAESSRAALRERLLRRSEAADIRARLEREELTDERRGELERELERAEAGEEKAREMLNNTDARLFVDISHSAVTAHAKAVWEAFHSKEDERARRLEKFPVFNETKDSTLAKEPGKRWKEWMRLPQAELKTAGEWQQNEAAVNLFERYRWTRRRDDRDERGDE